MNFIDLSKQHEKVKDGVNARIQKIFEHGRYINGPEVGELEQILSDYIGVKHSIVCSNGTDALLIALLALEVRPGDEVITTPFSFFAAAEMTKLLGAIPRFVDIDENSYNLDPNLLEAAINEKTKAIIPVSLYGQCPDMDGINAVAKKHNIPVIEDAAQSFGATYKGKKSCNLSEIATTSFYPSKPLGAYGEGGACFTNDDELAKKLRMVRIHGDSGRYNHEMIGINGRLNSIQAAVLIEKMKIFPEEVELRYKAGKYYSENLPAELNPPKIDSDYTSVYAQFTLRVNDREEFVRKMQERGIPTAVHYPNIIQELPCIKGIDKTPIAKKMSEVVVSLPMHPYITREDQDKVIQAVKESV